MTFDHNKALAGEPVYWNEWDITLIIRWFPFVGMWELQGNGWAKTWNKNGQPLNHRGAPLTTTAPEGDKTK